MAGQIVAAQAVGKIAENKYTPIVLGLVILGSGVGAYFLVVKPILTVLGVIESEDDKLEQDIMKLKGFDPNFSNPTKVTLTSDSAKQIAEDLKDSIGDFLDESNFCFI